MRRNLINALAIIVAVATFSFTADAQFGNLGNKIKNKIEQKTKETINKEKNKVENKINDAVDNAIDTGKKKLEDKANEFIDAQIDKAESAILDKIESWTAYKPNLNVDRTSSIDDLYTAYEYLIATQAEKAEKGDVEYLCSSDGQKATDIWEIIESRGDKYSSPSHDYTTDRKFYVAASVLTHNALLEGEPDVIDGNSESLAKAVEWNYNKYKASKKGNAKTYYLARAAQTRYEGIALHNCFDNSSLQKVNADLVKAWKKEKMEKKDNYASKYAQFDPNKPYETIAGEKESYKASIERKKAELAEIKKADVEANQMDMPTGGKLNKTMNAKVLAAAKKKFGSGVEKVVINNAAWDSEYDNGSLVRRTLEAWVVMKDAEGFYIADLNTFAEDAITAKKFGNTYWLQSSNKISYVKYAPASSSKKSGKKSSKKK